MMREHDREPTHVEHVSQLALQLFDQLAPLHQLGANDRFILLAAALLHDIGWPASEGGRKHHKIAARMIRQQRWKSVPDDWIPLIACVARYHRRTPPREHHRKLLALARADETRVRLLVPLLRLADALDRTHLCRVTRVHASLKPGAIEIRLEGLGEMDAEIKTALRKSDAFPAAYGHHIQIVNGPACS